METKEIREEIEKKIAEIHVKIQAEKDKIKEAKTCLKVLHKELGPLNCMKRA